ncbi:MAG: hypothetical protein RJB39_347 [Candidatus Parcubacteria bacterium]|jgi:hypothetical protein
MYSDIIAPKKNSIRRITRDASFEEVSEKVYLSERPQRERKFPKMFLFLIVAVLLIGGVIYAKFSERTVMTFTPKTTTLDIRERIPIYLQVDARVAGSVNTESLPYSLIYISSKTDRNPFAPMVSATTTAPTTNTSATLSPLEIVATTTGAKMNVYLVNVTGESLPLRATTRIDINGLTYSIASAITVPVTKDVALFKDLPKYYLPGFKGTAQAQSIYAVPIDATAPTDTAVTTSEPNKSSVPEDILSLLPDTSVALRKSTIYDLVVGQTAVVTFDKKDLLVMLEKKSPAFQEYVMAFKPLVDVVSYKVQVADYELDSAPDTGRPMAFKKLILEITPIMDEQKTKTIFINFSLDAMEVIQNQIAKFATLDISSTPFWSSSVAGEGKVEVKTIAE